jgi:hypothetical protein
MNHRKREKMSSQLAVTVARNIWLAVPEINLGEHSLGPESGLGRRREPFLAWIGRYAGSPELCRAARRRGSGGVKE